MTRRLRIWMNGCLAVVLAAVGGELVRPAAERMMTVRQSRYDADETLRKIERAAHGHGYTIFARVSAPEAEAAARSYALVLGVDEGVTPVVVDEAGNSIDAPLALTIVSWNNGRTEVRLAEHANWPDREDGDASSPRLAPLASVVDAALA